LSRSGPAGLLIRREEPADRAPVFALNASAFETELEARLVDALRGAARPLVSLVAEREGRIVGHILFSPVSVDDNPDELLVVGLGPMAVEPALQRQGIGGALVRRGLEECRAAGVAAVVLVGHADYYPRFGFEPAAGHGLRYRSPELDPWFMALALRPGALEALAGEVHYHPEFERAEAAGTDATPG
jgi:putative acetyltransferase